MAPPERGHRRPSPPRHGDRPPLPSRSASGYESYVSDKGPPTALYDKDGELVIGDGQDKPFGTAIELNLYVEVTTGKGSLSVFCEVGLAAATAIRSKVSFPASNFIPAC